MPHTIAQIAQALGAECDGDTELAIDRAAEPDQAGPNDLALALSPKYAAGVLGGRAHAAMLWPGADWQAMGLRAVILRHVDGWQWRG